MHPKAHPGQDDKKFVPRLVAWELTRHCNLDCVHCRAAASKGPYENELTTEECFRILKEIKEVGSPIIILTGGEPLMRPDIFEIAKEASRLGFRPVMATNGVLISREIAQKMKETGIARVSISLDGATPASHDDFRKVPGAFEGALRGIEFLKEADIPFQINTTVTEVNVDEVPKILDLTIKLGAVAHHIFLLVPVGRGKDMASQALTAEKYEKVLHWFYDQRKRVPEGFHLKATCAPHYYRILRQRAREEGQEVTYETFGLDAVTRGCLAGTGFCFISHRGVVQPCGYLELNCGSLREKSFPEVWWYSEIFENLRNFKAYKGKCGRCEYIRVCGGCRARAYEATGDYLAEEPLCSYEPKKKGG